MGGLASGPNAHHTDNRPTIHADPSASSGTPSSAAKASRDRDSEELAGGVPKSQVCRGSHVQPPCHCLVAWRQQLAAAAPQPSLPGIDCQGGCCNRGRLFCGGKQRTAGNLGRSDSQGNPEHGPAAGDGAASTFRTQIRRLQCRRTAAVERGGAAECRHRGGTRTRSAGGGSSSRGPRRRRRHGTHSTTASKQALRRHLACGSGAVGRERVSRRTCGAAAAGAVGAAGEQGGQLHAVSPQPSAAVAARQPNATVTARKRRSAAGEQAPLGSLLVRRPVSQRTF